ncbi:MAG: CocE/NonD family hydrolase, partial [Caldithrix sp.]|nr:CocE/NonD family hydrolase [Caldithrix sp.]
RPDVLSFISPVLSDSLTVAGPLMANLSVAITGTDADWVVKLIDVYPDTTGNPDNNPCNVQMGGYQRLLRAEIMRSKFRNSFSDPEPLEPDSVHNITIRMNDVLHTFKPGHRIMIQVQSSWFPLFDRNPQTFVDIYQARRSDFKKAVHKVYHSHEHPSFIKMRIFKPHTMEPFLITHE